MTLQLVPRVRWVAGSEHVPTHPVRISLRAVGAPTAIVVDPHGSDGLVVAAVPEERPVLLEEDGAEPVRVLAAERVTLPIRRPRGVLWNDIERKFRDGGEALRGVRTDVVLRVAPPRPFDLTDERLELIEEEAVGV